MLFRKSYRQKRVPKKKFCYWAPRVTALIFTALFYYFIWPSFSAVLENYPIFFNFFVATLTFALTIIFWGKGGLWGAAGFFLAGLLYPLVLWHHILNVSVLAISIMLLMIGFLFLLDSYESRPAPDNIKSKRSPVYFREYKR